MMWFFAVLVVLSLGGVAAVAAGRGRPMAIEYDDRPDVTVPAGQPLAEGDVRRVRFSTALLGYRQSEVDALLERLARELGDRAAADAQPPAAAPDPAVARRADDGPAGPPPTSSPAASAAETPAAGRTPWWSRRRAGSRPRSE